MAELLIRVVDKISDDFYLNTQLTKRGDVIVAQPDGWAWGKLELSNPDWRIIVVAGEADDFVGLVAPEPETDPLNPSRTRQRRAFRLDLESRALSAEIASHIADDARATAKIELAKTVLDTATVRKPVIADPAVIGDSDPKVVG